MDAREAHGRAAVAAARRGHIATLLFAAANRLATLADLDELPLALSRAAREVTGATFAGVAVRIDGTSAFRHVAGEGLPAEAEEQLRGRTIDASEYPFLDAALDPDRPQPARQPDGSWRTESSRLAVAPIVVGGEVWGVLTLGVAADDERSLDDWQVLAEGLASIGGGAIARAEVAGELERQRHRSGTLLELSSMLAEVQEPGEIAWLVCDFIRRASGAPFAMLGRRDADGDAFSIAATSGLSEDQVALIGAALRRTDRPSLQQLLGGGIATRHGEREIGAGMGLGEAMGAPLVADGRTIGFLAIAAPVGETVRLEDWQELLMAFAAVTATAMSRAEAVGELAAQRDVLASEVELRTRSLQTALDELRVASDAKTEFLGNVSHELRTPLTAILGFAEILSSGIDGRLTPEQARDVGTIQVSSRHLLELIDDLIDIASIESGRFQLVAAPVVAEDVVRDAVATIRPLAGEKGIALEVEAPPTREGRPVRVVADRGRLREILLNVLSNAVKFTPSSGSVRVSFSVDPWMSPLREGPGPCVAIAVRDSGHGIAPEDQERIFEKFVRIAGPGTPGTGLGLPISRELARLHGGDLTVESTPGLGSTFTVRIPLALG
jgi:signal transduction histidine kinase